MPAAYLTSATIKVGLELALAVKISVQMCSYNRADLLKRALEALVKVDFATEDFEIVLVDDGSSDCTREMVAGLQHDRQLKYLYQDNAGLATARNTGIRAAQGEVILFIDDDTMADPALLKENWASHQEDDKCVVNGRVNHVETLDGELSPKFTTADISTSFFWTSNVSVRRKYLEQVGLFDQDFREYGWEDIELVGRLRDIGLRRRYNHNALVYHYKRKRRASELPRMLRQSGACGRSAVIYLRKRPRLRTRLSTGLFGWRIVLNDIARILRPWCLKVVEGAGDRELNGCVAFCARMLMSFEYYEAVKAALRAEKAG